MIQATLGTTITGNETGAQPVTAGMVRNYCIKGFIPGTVCCQNIQGTKYLDEQLACPPAGDYYLVDPKHENVTLEIQRDGRAIIIGGPPRTELTDPFYLPGDSRAPRKSPAPSKGASPPVSTGHPPATTPPPEGGVPSWVGPAVFGAGVLIALISLWPRASGGAGVPAAGVGTTPGIV